MRSELARRFPVATAGVCYAALYATFFAPALVAGRLLAPGDGILFNVPAFLAPRFELWTDMLCAGYPAAADPQMATWYPLALLLSLGGIGWWNAYVLLAYVLASAFAFGFARAATGSTLGAAVAGCVVGLCGFMVAHAGHTNMVHAAAWIPLVLWATEERAREGGRGWLAVAALAVAMSALAGHPQILVSLLALTACHAVVRFRLGSWCLATALGLGLAGIQLVPAIELARLSNRASMSYAEFTSYALAPRQSIDLLFPYLSGGAAFFYRTAYDGVWIVGEVTGYVGLATLVLAGLAISARRRDPAVWLWTIAGAAALLLALGGATPLARVLYHVPPFSAFRAPGRYFVVFAVAAAALAAYGVAAIESGDAERSAVRTAVRIGAGVMLAGAAIGAWVRGPFDAAVVVPLVVYALGIAALLFWAERPTAPARRALLIAAVVLDLASFGWFFPWRPAPPASAFAAPEGARRFAETLAGTGQRIAPVRDAPGAVGFLAPNLSRLWSVPSAGGYTPLVPARYAGFARVAPGGDVAPPGVGDATLDLLAVRYVVLSGASAGGATDLGVELGDGCGAKRPSTAALALAEPVRATAVVVTSALACAAAVEDGVEVARVEVTGADGVLRALSLRAGRDTSEWAYDCPDVALAVRHARAPVAESFPTTRDSGAACEGHRYVATLALDAPVDVARITIVWTGPAGSLSVRSVALVGEDGAARTPAYLPGALGDASRWRLVQSDELARVYENLWARPRAWLAPEAVALGDDAALGAIRTSTLPGGTAFDPARTALVATNGLVAAPDPEATARVVRATGGAMDVRTRSASPSLLVTSDAWYPGWTAIVDGESAEVERVDYGLRGVRLAAGEHTVLFRYRPWSLTLGATTSVLALLALLALLGARNRAR